EATIRVTAAVAKSVALTVERTHVEDGLPVRFTVAVRDAYGNDAAATTMVAAKQGTTTIAHSLAGNEWLAPGTGTYTLVATSAPTGGGALLTDSATVTVVAATDVEGPAITFRRPAGDPTLGAWPAPGRVTANGCAGDLGDLVGVTLADPSNVSRYWFEY